MRMAKSCWIFCTRGVSSGRRLRGSVCASGVHGNSFNGAHGQRPRAGTTRIASAAKQQHGSLSGKIRSVCGHGSRTVRPTSLAKPCQSRDLAPRDGRSRRKPPLCAETVQNQDTIGTCSCVHGARGPLPGKVSIKTLKQNSSSVRVCDHDVELGHPPDVRGF